MKLLWAILISGISLQVSAVSLVAEAICRGRLDGNPITVQALVNPSNWCERSANDQNSAILIRDGADIAVHSSVTTEILRGDDINMTLLSTDAQGHVKLTYTIELIPGRGNGQLEIMENEGTDSKSVELRCEFPEYDMDC